MHNKRFLEQRITNTFKVDRGGERADLLNWDGGGGYFELLKAFRYWG